ncbi:MAG: hypothetical protein AB1646_02075 [Thermodesulfobacteriota bacterium]
MGLWNVAIFSPRWMGAQLKELFGLPRMDVSFITDERGPQVRYGTERFEVFPQASGLIVAMKRIDDESLQDAERLVAHILKTLSHTPISAFGVNFALQNDEISPDLASFFRLDDGVRLAENDFRSTKLSIQRSLAVDDAVLNVTLTAPGDRSPLSVHLNFHHDVTCAEEARRSLSGRVLRYKSYGLDFLDRVYGLTMEDAP